MGKAIAPKTRDRIQSILNELINDSLVLKSLAVKKTDGSLYASSGFLPKEDVGGFATTMARIFRDTETELNKLRITLRNLPLPGGITIVYAGTAALLIVVIDQERIQRSMIENINSRVKKAAGLIAEAMGEKI